MPFTQFLQVKSDLFARPRSKPGISMSISVFQCSRPPPRFWSPRINAQVGNQLSPSNSAFSKPPLIKTKLCYKGESIVTLLLSKELAQKGTDMHGLWGLVSPSFPYARGEPSPGKCVCSTIGRLGRDSKSLLVGFLWFWADVEDRTKFYKLLAK